MGPEVPTGYVLRKLEVKRIGTWDNSAPESVCEDIAVRVQTLHDEGRSFNTTNRLKSTSRWFLIKSHVRSLLTL